MRTSTKRELSSIRSGKFSTQWSPSTDRLVNLLPCILFQRASWENAGLEVDIFMCITLGIKLELNSSN